MRTMPADRFAQLHAAYAVGDMVTVSAIIAS
jgi:hypothetical protein